MPDNENTSLSEDKARILVDSLPYIRDFNQKIMVICFTASNILDDRQLQEVMRDIALMKSIGMRPIVVHDSRMGYDKFRENKRFAKLIELCGIRSVGICGIDLQTIKMTLDNDYIPVITPNDIDTEDQVITPEEAASEIAMAIGAEKVIFVCSVDGIHDPETDKIISQMKRSRASSLRESITSDKFRRKIDEALRLLDGGVPRVHILYAGIAHGIILELFSVIGVGTMIMSDEPEYYKHEISYREKRSIGFL